MGLDLHHPDIDEATRTQGTLRVDPTVNGQNERVRWARDYELPA